jgi:adenosylcobinamide kinase/adenosylcobinamide-phosphate guanylyltransferase
MAIEQVTLVLGGARSGKSAYAESLAEAASGDPVYIATGAAGDAEMAARIADHKARRGERWRTVEEPLDLAGALEREAVGGRVVLVDCLTLWLTNVMAAGGDPAAEESRLVGALAEVGAPVVLVSNEVGLGIVPDNALARAFRDHAGRLNQAVAGVSDRVVFIAAGLPLTLK